MIPFLTSVHMRSDKHWQCLGGNWVVTFLLGLALMPHIVMSLDSDFWCIWKYFSSLQDNYKLDFTFTSFQATWVQRVGAYSYVWFIHRVYSKESDQLLKTLQALTINTICCLCVIYQQSYLGLHCLLWVNSIVIKAIYSPDTAQVFSWGQLYSGI